jgi:hypothetical protein
MAGKGTGEQAAHAMMARKGRQKMPELAGFLLFSFHSTQAPAYLMVQPMF